ncbi:hypothetical protein [Mahella australiensis]|uniref:Uncharacterized protein n=1 Tax=Mahella australiensis (strain DSM 15567 / CIP 107919 / 50-1 BON) TaxID=697281 RepID=F4A0L4_MAHA5|nr:hypothetical protein [Mahella australiensis]AEE95893.1 hypothetical protein Mahau_0691 [Mahella australiensis 50-1 BON]
MKKVIFTVLCMAVALILCVSFSSTATALAANNVNYSPEDNVIETPLPGKVTVKNLPSKNLPSVSPNSLLYSYSIRNISKQIFNLFYPLTNYATGYCNLTYSRSVAFTVDANISTSVGVSADIVQASIGSNVGVSNTVTASESVSYEIPSGYKGRIVIRYSQNYYTFTCVKRNRVTGSETTGPGSATTGAYDPYYARQLIAIS